MGLLSARRNSRRVPSTFAATAPATSAPAAPRIRPGKAGQTQGSIAQAWQHDAQAFYDSTGPLKYAAMYRGNMYRRVRLYAAVIPDDDGDPIPCEDILDPAKPAKAPPGIPDDLIRQAMVELSRIRHPLTGRAGLLYDFGVNLTTSGDCWLVAEPDLYEPNGESWSVYSVTELLKQGEWPDGAIRWQVAGPPTRTLAQGTLAYRFYQPHPHRHQYADAPTLGVLDDLEELALIRRAFRGMAKSRLSSSGLLLVPEELDFGTVDPDDPDSADKLTVDLITHLSAPLLDEASAANQVPHLLRGKSQYLHPDFLRHITFDRPADKVLDAREDKKLKTFAIGMDTPPEVILGIGDINHWGSWQVSESSWKAHGEPGMVLVCGLMGCLPLRSLLSGSSDSADEQSQRWTRQQIGRITVWYDASDLVDHPDQFADASKAHEAMVLSDDALRRYGNFEDQDKPTDDEVARRIDIYRAMHGTRGDSPGDTTGPEAPQTPEGPPAEGPPPAGQPPAQATVAAATPMLAAANNRPVGRTLTDLDLALYNKLHALCQATVHRQIEKANAQIISRTQRTGDLAARARAVPKRQVAATLGRPVVASLDLTDAQLVGDYHDLLNQVDSHTSRTRDAALLALLAAMRREGIEPTDAQLTAYQHQIDNAGQQGRDRLGQALLAYTLDLLYAAETDDDVTGEGVLAGELPPAIIRAAMAEYGGQLLTEDGYPQQPDQGVEPLRGVATGSTLLALAGDTGADTELWEWLHFTTDRPFLPHQDLDGQVFGGDPATDAETLAGPTQTWSALYPGDHPGCLCLVTPIVEWAGVG